MQLINPKPRKDWSIDQECFYFFKISNVIGKATVVGTNPVTEEVYLYDSSLEHELLDSMNCIFETQDEAMQALSEQVGIGLKVQPVINPEAKTDWEPGQKCFFVHTATGFIHKGSISGIDTATAQASIPVRISPAPDNGPRGDDDDADGAAKEVTLFAFVDMNCLFENEDDAKRAYMNQLGKA